MGLRYEQEVSQYSKKDAIIALVVFAIYVATALATLVFRMGIESSPLESKSFRL